MYRTTNSIKYDISINSMSTRESETITSVLDVELSSRH